MSITRIHAIKATVKKSIEYITDPDKTDDKNLVYTFGTSLENAASTFRLEHENHSGRDTNLAYHLIQSFAPGEVAPDEAHDIGKELADRLLGGKYTYVLSTHIDKGHVHNHLIFCSVDNIDHKKYHSCKESYRTIRRINYEICADHNLSVIQENNYKGKSYKEWKENRTGTSWKSQLKKDINETINNTHTYEDFLDQLRSKGYEIKDHEISPKAHKYIGFRAPGQERWIRGRAQSLGTDFTKERIRERIEEKARIRAEKMKKNSSGQMSIIDNSSGRYSQDWVDPQNLKTAAKIQSKLAELGLDDFNALNEKIESLHTQAVNGKRSTVALDKQIIRFEEILHYARVYTENKKYIHGYEKSKDKDRYYRTHGYEIEVANGAIDRLRNAGLDPGRFNLQKMEEDYLLLKKDRASSSKAYKETEKECRKLEKLREEFNSYLSKDMSKDQDRNKNRSI